MNHPCTHLLFATVLLLLLRVSVVIAIALRVAVLRVLAAASAVNTPNAVGEGQRPDSLGTGRQAGRQADSRVDDAFAKRIYSAEASSCWTEVGKSQQ